MSVFNNLGNRIKIIRVSVFIEKSVANFHFAIGISLSCFIHDYDQYLYRFSSLIYMTVRLSLKRLETMMYKPFDIEYSVIL